ncbi:ATP-binding protein [Rhizobium rhizogenes]|uniref:ATP-binding protein n=1 Tax=Rhizobium rhizogenes TaxID=359 RepID=UPI00226D8485|nr:ATP-binding protein [Rhizobium rhizogenes]
MTSGPRTANTEAQREILERLRGVGSNDALIAKSRSDIVEKLARPGLFSLSELKNLLSNVNPQILRSVEEQVLSASLAVDMQSGHFFRLKDDVRRDLVREKGPRVLEGGIRVADWDSFEKLLALVLEAGELNEANIQQFGAELAVRVVRILDDETLPSEIKIKSVARRLRHQEALEAVGNRIFVGRNQELSEVREFLIDSEAHRVLQIHGVAGVGKTTLIKKALLDVHEGRSAVIVEVDFERPVNNHNLVPFVGRELLYSLFEAGLMSEKRFASLEREVNEVLDATSLVKLVKRIVESETRNGGRVLFFFDSVEMFLNAFSDPVPLMTLIEALVEDIDGCFVLLATRLSTFEFRVPLKTISLEPLTKMDVREFCRMSDLSLQREHFVLRTLPDRNPLLLTLLVAAVKRDKDLSIKDLENKPWNDIFFQRYVLERLIDKLPKFLHREIARAALPLRRISAELLADGRIFPEVAKYLDRPVNDIFKELQDQVVFFETTDDMIYLRQDIRNVLLRIGNNTKQKIDFDATRRKAFDHYLKRAREGDLTASTEALYYALCLNEDKERIEQLWTSHGGSELLKYLADFTPRSRGWLKYKMDRRWIMEDFEDAFKEDAEFQSIGFVFNAFYAGRLDSIERLKNSNTVFRSASYSAVFADAMSDLGHLNFESALGKIAVAAMRAPEDAVHPILQQGLRIAAVSDANAGDIIDHTTRICFDLQERGNESKWLASYYALWIARLVPQRGALKNEVSKVKEWISKVEPRNLARISKLTEMQINDLCLLGSAEDADFAALWLKSANTKKLTAASLRHINNYLQTERRDVLPAAMLERLSSAREMTVPGKPVGWEAALHSYAKSRAVVEPGDVTSLRTAMLIQSSDILVGLLIASMQRHYRRPDLTEREKIFSYLHRRVSSEVNVTAVVSSTVRQLAREGELYRTIIDQGDDFEIREALSNWLRFFRIDIRDLSND